MFIVALAIKVLSEYNFRYACKNVRVHVIHVLESHIQFRQRYMYRTGTLNCEKFNHLGVHCKGIYVHMYVIEMNIAKKPKTMQKVQSYIIRCHENITANTGIDLCCTFSLLCINTFQNKSGSLQVFLVCQFNELRTCTIIMAWALGTMQFLL